MDIRSLERLESFRTGACLGKKDVEGIPYLRRAVRLDPKHKDAWTVLGIALQSQGHIQEAAAYYRKALELDSGYLPARQNLDQAERILTNSKR